MENFIQFVLPSLIAVAGVIISGLITFLISNRTLKNQYQSQIQEFKLEKINHAKKMHNEELYKIYHSLSETFLSMIQTNLYLFPPFLDRVPIDKEEKQKMYQSRFEKACKTFDEFNLYLHQNGAFLNKDIYDYFLEIVEECRKQIVFFPDFFLMERYGFERDDAETKQECWRRGNEIAKKQDEAIEFLRTKVLELES